MFNFEQMEDAKVNIGELVRDKLKRGVINKSDLAKKMDITRVTLNTRLERGNWKKSEVALLLTILG